MANFISGNCIVSWGFRLSKKLLTLQDELRKIAKDQGADLFGVADLTVAHEFVCSQGGEYLKRFPRAISIGVRLLDALVDELPRHEEPMVVFTYRGLYNTVNSRLDQVALSLSKRVQQEGYQAYPIPASQTVDSQRLTGAISHKLAAHLAGLGWIGKSCLLVTPGYGPRIRLATVITDASLEAGSPMDSRCGECRKCVDLCPVKAFTGIPFNPSEPREARFNANLCNQYQNKRRERLGDGLCGLCVYVCPYGTSKNGNNPRSHG